MMIKLDAGSAAYLNERGRPPRRLAVDRRANTRAQRVRQTLVDRYGFGRPWKIAGGCDLADQWFRTLAGPFAASNSRSRRGSI
jgi:hypothetical protein